MASNQAPTVSYSY